MSRYELFARYPSERLCDNPRIGAKGRAQRALTNGTVTISEILKGTFDFIAHASARATSLKFHRLILDEKMLELGDSRGV